MEIRKYDFILDYENLLGLIESEGKGWESYSSSKTRAKYRIALDESITYVAYEKDVLVGYSRSLDDCGFYIYVCDLLVSKEHRGHAIGKELIECLSSQFPEQTIYVMSDVDEYYKKLDYKKAGSIFEVI